MSDRGDKPVERRCQWCAEASPADATNCRACGAALILHEEIGAMVVPGVTHVDPELKAYDKRPLRIPRGSATEMIAGPAIGSAAAIGGPAGLLAMGALAAVGVQEWMNAGGKKAEMERWGEPSGPVMEMARRLAEEARAREESTAASADPDSPDPAADAGPEPAAG